MAKKVKFEKELNAEEAELFGKFLRDLRDLKLKKKVVHAENIWRPSEVRK